MRGTMAAAWLVHCCSLARQQQREQEGCCRHAAGCQQEHKQGVGPRLLLRRTRALLQALQRAAQQQHCRLCCHHRFARCKDAWKPHQQGMLAAGRNRGSCQQSGGIGQPV